MADLLAQLKSMTAIVADTGDIEAIRRHRPEDATTTVVIAQGRDLAGVRSADCGCSRLGQSAKQSARAAGA